MIQATLSLTFFKILFLHYYNLVVLLVEFLLAANISEINTVLMEQKNEFGMKLLLAKCPNCQRESLYCGKIPTAIQDLSNKEVLFCKSCKFVVTVEEYKEMLYRV